MDVLLTGAYLAAVYGLVAVGLTVTWSALGLFNVAQASAFAVGAYTAYVATSVWQLPSALVVAASVAGGAAVGVIVYVVIYLPLHGRPGWLTSGLIATLALDLLARNVLERMAGSGYRNLPPVFGERSWRFGDVVVSAYVAGALAVTVVVFAGMFAVLQRTRVGLGARILSQDPEGVSLVGIDRRVLALGVLAVSGGLAGLAGILLSQTFILSPAVAAVPFLKGMIVTLLGGLGSLRGTLLAAVVVGMTEALTARLLGQGSVLIALFIVISVVLLVRPRGIGGMLEVSRA